MNGQTAQLSWSGGRVMPSRPNNTFIRPDNAFVKLVKQKKWKQVYQMIGCGKADFYNYHGVRLIATTPHRCEHPFFPLASRSQGTQLIAIHLAARHGAVNCNRKTRTAGCKCQRHKILCEQRVQEAHMLLKSQDCQEWPLTSRVNRRRS